MWKHTDKGAPDARSNVRLASTVHARMTVATVATSIGIRSYKQLMAVWPMNGAGK